MKLSRLRLSNFRSFSANHTELDLDHLTFQLGPNGAGKTAVLQALARMFSLDPAQRKVKKSDFHIPQDEKPEQAPTERELWIEADFEFPELVGKGGDKAAPAVPGNFAHMQLTEVKGPAQVRFRLHAKIDQDDDIEENFTFVIKVDDNGHPLEEGGCPSTIGTRSKSTIFLPDATRRNTSPTRQMRFWVALCAQRIGRRSARKSPI